MTIGATRLPPPQIDQGKDQAQRPHGDNPRSPLIAMPQGKDHR